MSRSSPNLLAVRANFVVDFDEISHPLIICVNWVFLGVSTVGIMCLTKIVNTRRRPHFSCPDVDMTQQLKAFSRDPSKCKAVAPDSVGAANLPLLGMQQRHVRIATVSRKCLSMLNMARASLRQCQTRRVSHHLTSRVVPVHFAVDITSGFGAAPGRIKPSTHGGRERPGALF